MNQPRQCSGCKTWYAPQVEKCECDIGAVNMKYGYVSFGKPGICEGVVHDFYMNESGNVQCRKCGGLRT